MPDALQNLLQPNLDTELSFLEQREPFPLTIPFPRVLMSYFFFRKQDMGPVLQDLPAGTDTFADSGAYSAYESGETLSVETYGAWLLKQRQHFRQYANLDVKGSWEQGWKHQQYLEGLGLHPLPVFHAGEPMELLEEMIAKYPYIALGGVAGIHLKMTGPTMLGWFTDCFTRAEGKAVFHGFGIAHPKLLVTFPWYSVDTSSWAGARYGLVNLFDYHAGKFVRLHTGDWRGSIKNAYLFDQHLLDWRKLADRANFGSREIQIASIRAYGFLQDYYQKLKGPVFMPEDRAASPLYQPEPGLKVYLAFVNDACIDMAMVACGLKTMREAFAAPAKVRAR